MIFVSYSRDDADFVDKLVADLEESSIETWVDRRDIPSGQRWDRVVQKALDSCEALLLVLSEASVQSEEVMYEVNHVLSSKPVVSILYRPCVIPYRLESLQYIDFTGDNGYPLDSLLLALRCLRPQPLPVHGDFVLELFSPCLRRLVYEFEHWAEFNEQTPGGPRSKKPMMIQKMASSDLFHEFIPLGMDYIDIGAKGWAQRQAGNVADLEAMLIHYPVLNETPRMLLVLGDYGTGKSSYAIHLAYRAARERIAHPLEIGAIPVYIDLRDFRRFGKMEEFLVDLMRDKYQIQLDLRRMRRLLDEGRLLLIFDGFDEMASRGNLHETLSNFREIKRVSLPGVKTLLTSRTHYFRSDREAEQVFEGRAMIADNPLIEEIKERPEFLVVQLREFSDEQIRELIARRMGCGQVERVWAEISQRYNLPELARRAVLLDMILTTMPSLLARGDTINAGHVYEAYTTLWIDREDWRSNLTPAGKASLMKRLAWRMIESWLSQPGEKDRGVENAGIRVSELLQTAGPVTESWLKPDDRMRGDEEDRIDYDLRTCSFLRRDSEGRYFFSHQSFLEYFCALHMLDSVESEDCPLLAQRLASYWTTISWEWPSPEIVQFLLSLLRGNPERRSRILRLTHARRGSGGNALTLFWEASRTGVPHKEIGPNLRDCVAYALDLAGCNLPGADFSGAALASADLEGSNLLGSTWELAACRIDHAYDINFAPDGSELMIGAGNGTLSSWDWKAMTRTRRLALHTDYVFDMAVDPGRNRWAYTTWDGWVHLHDCEGGRRIWSISGEGAGKGKIAFSHGAEYLAAGSWDGWVRIWQCERTPVEAASWHIGVHTNCLVFHPLNKYLLAAGEGLHRLSPGQQAQSVGRQSSIEAAAFHPAGHPVALSFWQSHTIALMDIESDRTLRQIETPVWNCYALAFSPDGNLLAVGGQNGIALVNLSTGTGAAPPEQIGLVREATAFLAGWQPPHHRGLRWCRAGLARPLRDSVGGDRRWHPMLRSEHHRRQGFRGPLVAAVRGLGRVVGRTGASLAVSTLRRHRPSGGQAARMLGRHGTHRVVLEPQLG